MLMGTLEQALLVMVTAAIVMTNTRTKHTTNHMCKCVSILNLWAKRKTAVWYVIVLFLIMIAIIDKGRR